MLNEVMDQFKSNPTFSNAKVFFEKVKELALHYYQQKYDEPNMTTVISTLFVEVYKISFPECEAGEDAVERLKAIVEQYEDLNECSVDFQDDMKKCIDKIYKKRCCV